jgi:hypothetical protein
MLPMQTMPSTIFVTSLKKKPVFEIIHPERSGKLFDPIPIMQPFNIPERG